MVNPLTRVISVIEELILRSVFIGNDEWWRHSSIFSSLVLVCLLVFMTSWCGRYGFLASLIIVLSIHVVARTLRLFMYSIVLAAIPTAWYIVTSLPFTGSLIDSLMVGIRVLINTISILTLVFMFNPMEVSVIMRKIGFRESSMYPAFLWKVVPHTLKDMKLALLANELKGEPLWKGIAVSFVASVEHSRMYEEALHVKLSDFRPRYVYSKRALVLHVALIAIAVTYILLNYAHVLP